MNKKLHDELSYLRQKEVDQAERILSLEQVCVALYLSVSALLMKTTLHSPSADMW